ncbi:MAG: class I SAM-dependent methyltransferase [Chitinophagales bacterium]
MGDLKFEMFRNRLTKLYRHLGAQARKQKITCFRLYDHDLPEFPFCIEIYGDKICLAEYKRHHRMTEEEHQGWLEECFPIMSSVLGIPADQIYLRQRQRKEGRQGQYEKLSHTDHFFQVEESGLKFWVNLTDYLDTGLFLDHRMTRSRVQSESLNRKVLNLFCYTGSFSVFAAAGGAASVYSVDLSKTYLAWAESNMKINQLLDSKKHFFIHADVMQWLDNIAGEDFDLVILDPPTFSNSKRMKDFLDIQRDHADMINRTLLAMKSGGILYFSCNYKKFQLDSGKIKTNLIKDISKSTTAFDFQGKLSRYCFRMIKQ